MDVNAQAPDTNAVIYYTLDGSLPTTNSFKYTGPIVLTNGAITVSANAFAAGHTNSVAVSALFVVQPLYFASAGITNQNFTVQFVGAAGSNYVLQATTDFTNWVPVATNIAPSGSLHADGHQLQVLLEALLPGHTTVAKLNRLRASSGINQIAGDPSTWRAFAACFASGFTPVCMFGQKKVAVAIIAQLNVLGVQKIHDGGPRHLHVAAGANMVAYCDRAKFAMRAQTIIMS